MEQIIGKQPIDIFSMIDTNEKKRSELLNKTCQTMKALKNEGKTPQEIEFLIKKINLPLDMHLCVFGHFTEICKYGRLLTKNERKVLS